MRDPLHPVLKDAYQYHVVMVHLELAPIDGGEPYLDLGLQRGAERVHLRFWSPQDLSIERGGPVMTSGLCILDIRSRQLDGLGIQVDDFESTNGSIRFMSRSVVALPQ